MARRLFSTLLFAFSMLFGESLSDALTPVKSACPGKSNIAVIPGASLNIRNEPGGTSDIIGTLSDKDGIQRGLESRTVGDRNFLHLEKGGWILEKYLLIVCVFETPTPTATLRPTSTPVFTPTRILHNFIYCKRGSVTVTPVANMDLVECESP